MNSGNIKTLHEQGWILTETGNDREMLNLALRLGTPKASRKGGALIDELQPISKEEAYPASLSARHGTGAFPLHTDTAHWRKPARYVILRAVRTLHNGRPTLLMDKRSFKLGVAECLLFRRAVFTVRNGKNSFLTTILTEDEQLLRFDRDCMFPKMSSADRALHVMLSTVEKCPVVEIDWSVNRTLVFDNWRFLHGRSAPKDARSARRLLHRILVSAVN